ncbi:zinc ribbon domain-containing protein [Streptomyces sp. CB01635]|uniref:zinc ribbon domain-containing protein n=1 Tax=Streptomyces sp. NPDC000188 TaxID=3154245 RepID=UPI002D794304|nr:zinc ribbon domain-containing protein [Streptomyces sp. CB01635]
MYSKSTRASTWCTSIRRTPPAPAPNAGTSNRVSQARFVCRFCGVVAHVDWNGSRNIRHRAEELWRRGAQSTAPDPPPNTGRGTGPKPSTTASGAPCASPGL